MANEYSEIKQDVNLLIRQIKKYEEQLNELKQRSDIQEALNEMLNISLLPLPLNEQMHRILLLVLNIPWLALEKKGCVFLVDDTGHGLNMVADHNLNSSLLSMCKHIQFGQCLCGKAAETQQLIFRNCIDHDHDIRPEGMKPHGHYNTPIILNNKVLAVLNLYVKHGHKSSSLEKNFLEATAAAMANIIERKKFEEQLHALSHKDELTGIANRRQFMKRLSEEIRRTNNTFALLFIDLDHFKQINDSYGHDYGDLILIHVARRAQKCLQEADLFARLGGDEFVTLLKDFSSPEHVFAIAKAMIHALSKPYHIKDTVLSVGASIGISLYPQHGSEIEELLKKADDALYKAKEKRGEVVIHT